MGVMKYKTRNMSNPRGKNKVFLTGHPADIKQYLEPISELILKYQDCAIWYAEDGIVEDIELLQDMQLFVMPVTADFLYRKNEAFSRHLPYAKERHIPVLPILMEKDKGLENSFNKLCGNLQLISAVQDDITAISYETKLKNYLGNVLVGNEMAAKIREEFDAYIFMSYRKMDRRHAQELMKLIHKNPICRDIAIWYDEYLTPGENYDNEIGRALDKSKLFALVITANLVNSEYIYENEFCRALNQNKPILPVEMERTNREELLRKFRGLVNIVNAEEEDVFMRELLAKVGKIALAENDADPIHNYYIGLAYLNGIDVEVDSDRAVKLITEAAENNVYEAMLELWSMYEYGHGVSRNQLEAIKWLKKMTAYCEERYVRNPGEMEYEQLSTIYPICINQLRKLGLLGDAKVYSNKYIMLLDEAVQKTGDYQILHKLLIAVLDKGCILDAEGRYEESKTLFESSVGMAEKIAAHTGTQEAYHDYARCCQEMGANREMGGDYDIAAFYYEKSVAIEEKLVEKNASADKSYLAIGYTHLGKICEKKGQFNEAVTQYKLATQVRTQILNMRESIDNKLKLAESLDDVAKVLTQQGNYVEADKYLNTALQLRMSVVEATKSVESICALQKSASNIARNYIAQGKLAEAYNFCKMYVDLAEENERESMTIRNVETLIDSYELMEEMYREQRNADEVIRYNSLIIQLITSLSDEMKTPYISEMMGWAYYRIGQVYDLVGMSYETKRYLAPSIEIGKLLSETTELLGVKLLLYENYLLLGVISEREGNRAAALDYYKKCLEAAQILAEKSETKESIQRLAMSYLRVGDVYDLDIKRVEAMSYYQGAEKWANKLYSFGALSEVDMRTVHVCIAHIGDEAYTMGDKRAALYHFERAVVLYCETVGRYRNAATQMGKRFKYYWALRAELGTPAESTYSALEYQLLDPTLIGYDHLTDGRLDQARASFDQAWAVYVANQRDIKKEHPLVQLLSNGYRNLR